ncbi:ABC transporter ATP-binding protein [Pseudobutyrivibrio xylanivorans]|uniref:ABC-type cobalamin/Fe3+-siderophores transport system, ATPase component n=1 Tax=Pseudobutyrivibrio xylanivorans TaxID=185007 RepID=A0A1G5RZ11_PSEXY|nr:ABC transporter ATP-binding protein [Pseudobutyrivibrio xylanivorans]SCZ79385.1 ABC-type cobalamin/Fe3+-siderophores transport system, ATPase component [Pseudobutyrivibrio xylanivorans]
MEQISARDLTVGYGKAVISDATFQVLPGEIIALIGPNGSGKSTILKTITRQLKKMSGKLFIGEDIDDSLTEVELAKKMSMLMTERIHPELMTCFEVVAMGRYPYTGRLGFLTAEDKKKVEEAIALVGAEDVANKDFMKISDGQRQRVMLARAIAQEPEIMILDEPTSFLDIQYKIDILSVIKKLAVERNIAVLMSIHELEFVPAIADKVIGICDGSIYKIGTPEEIFTGENLEKMYRMKPGTGDRIISGLLEYSKCLK